MQNRTSNIQKYTVKRDSCGFLSQSKDTPDSHLRPTDVSKTVRPRGYAQRSRVIDFDGLQRSSAIRHVAIQREFWESRG